MQEKQMHRNYTHSRVFLLWEAYLSRTLHREGLKCSAIIEEVNKLCEAPPNPASHSILKNSDYTE